MNKYLHPIKFPRAYLQNFSHIPESGWKWLLEMYQDREINWITSAYATLKSQGSPDGQTRSTLEYIVARLFNHERGAIIEVTPSLITLLGHTDFGDVPANMFEPPYAFNYFELNDGADLFAGIYVWQTQWPIDGKNKSDVDFFERMSGVEYDGSRYIRKVTFAVTSTKLPFGFKIVDTGYVIYENCSDSLMDTLEWNAFGTMQDADEEELDNLRAYLNLAMKIVLYMGCKDARVVQNNEYENFMNKLSGLGRKKLAKLSGRADKKYDCIIVGPETLSDYGLQAQGEGTKTTHWRRGHFRNQPHGPGNQDRRMVWIRPMIINSQPDVSVAKKTYRVR